MSKKSRPRLSMSLWFTVLLFIENIAAVGIATASVSILNSVVPNGIKISAELLVFLFSLVIGVSLSLLSNKLFLLPLRTLYLKMRKVSKGDFTVRIDDKSRIKEIDNMYKNFNLMVKELGKLETIQSDFVSNVSHEFKTPLSAIEGYSMLLQGSENISKEQELYIQKILFNTERLSALVGNILLLAKLDNQNIQAKRNAFRLDEQIRQAILLNEISWSKKNIYLDVELESAEFFGTEELLLHVWNNLISNAIKFSPNDQTVMICLTKTEESLIFSIADKGKGLSDEVIKHMFDKFYQGDSAHKAEGNGLGLALAKRIVNMNNGTITAENLTDGGCEFIVTLKRNVQDK